MNRVPRLVRWSPAFVLAAGLAGCGGSSTGSSGVTATHGGTLLELPGRAGFVELVVEPTDPKAKGPRAKGKVVAYFVNRDGSAPPTPVPSDVSFTDETGKSYPLAPQPGAAAGAARFESGPVALPPGEAEGKLDAKLGGDTIHLVNRPR